MLSSQVRQEVAMKLAGRPEAKGVVVRVFWLMFALISSSSVLAQEPVNLKDQVIESAGPGWTQLQQAFEQDGTWRVQWSDGVDVDIRLARRGGLLLATDTRKLNATRAATMVRPKRQAERGAEIVKLIQHSNGWYTFEKAENDEYWKRRADEPTGSNKAEQRLFLNTLWSASPWAIVGVPLGKIFADADTVVETFVPVEDQPGIYRIEFSMQHGLASPIPGVGVMAGSAPFVHYPAQCKLFVDANHDWRVTRLEFQRERANHGSVFDQMAISYVSSTEFTVSSGQGNSAEAARLEKMKYVVTFHGGAPEQHEFETGHYKVAESSKGEANRIP